MHTSRRPLVAGNWKMNGNGSLVKQVEQCLASADLGHLDVLVCPPAVYLSQFSLDGLLLGGQNMSQFSAGAHTGETSGEMLKDVGCSHVIVGHSERRADNYETNGVVADKVKAAIDAGITPVLCVGEPEEIRDDGSLFTFIAAQLDAVISLVGIAAFDNVVLAYEPVWAIGTGKTASPAQAQEVHEFIRNHLAALDANIAQKIQILYGGSVNAKNAAELFGQPDVDGGLIGGASLDPESFLSVCQAAKL